MNAPALENKNLSWLCIRLYSVLFNPIQRVVFNIAAQDENLKRNRHLLKQVESIADEYPIWIFSNVNLEKDVAIWPAIVASIPLSSNP